MLLKYNKKEQLQNTVRRSNRKDNLYWRVRGSEHTDVPLFSPHSFCRSIDGSDSLFQSWLLLWNHSASAHLTQRSCKGGPPRSCIISVSPNLPADVYWVRPPGSRRTTETRTRSPRGFSINKMLQKFNTIFFQHAHFTNVKHTNTIRKLVPSVLLS